MATRISKCTNWTTEENATINEVLNKFSGEFDELLVYLESIIEGRSILAIKTQIQKQFRITKRCRIFDHYTWKQWMEKRDSILEKKRHIDDGHVRQPRFRREVETENGERNCAVVLTGPRDDITELLVDFPKIAEEYNAKVRYMTKSRQRLIISGGTQIEV